MTCEIHKAEFHKNDISNFTERSVVEKRSDEDEWPLPYDSKGFNSFCRFNDVMIQYVHCVYQVNSVCNKQLYFTINGNTLLKRFVHILELA